MSIKPLQLRLKVAWFKNFLGLDVDQIDTNQQYFLTPYYFWPRTEAWEQLKLELDSKVWLKRGKDENFENFKDAFRETGIVIINEEY